MAGLSDVRGTLSYQGRSVEEWDKKTFKQRVAYLPPLEASAAFSLTLGENIAVGDEEQG